MKRTTPNNLKGIIAIIILTSLFASIGIFARIMEASFSIFQQTYLRMFAALLFGLVFFFNDIHWKKLLHIPKKDLLIMIVRTFSFYIGGVILFTLAVFNTTLGNVSLIQALPAVAIFGVLFFHEKLTWWKVFYIFLSFVGVAFISIGSFKDIFSWGVGQTYSLMSAFFFSFSFIARKWQSDYLNNKEMTQVILFFAVISLLICSFFFKEGLPLYHWNWLVFSALLVSGFYNVAQLFLINYGFQHVKPFLASNLLTMEGLFAIIFGFLIYKETPTLQGLIGGLIIVISVIGMNHLEQG